MRKPAPHKLAQTTIEQTYTNKDMLSALENEFTTPSPHIESPQTILSQHPTQHIHITPIKSGNPGTRPNAYINIEENSVPLCNYRNGIKFSTSQ